MDSWLSAKTNLEFNPASNEVGAVNDETGVDRFGMCCNPETVTNLKECVSLEGTMAML